MILDEKVLTYKCQEKIYNKLNNFEILKIIGEIGDECNIKLYAIGGFVRDLILDRENYDIDILKYGKYPFHVSLNVESCL